MSSAAPWGPRTVKTPRHEARASLLGGQDPSYQPLSGGYHERQGLPVGNHDRRRSRSSKMYVPNSKWTWIFVGIALVQAAIVLAFEAYVFGKFQSNLTPQAQGQTQQKTIPTFLTLYIFGFLYQLVLVWDALRMKNTIQIFGLVLMNVGLLIYGAVQLEQIKQAIFALGSFEDEGTLQIWSDEKPFLIAIPAVIAFGTVLLGIAGYKLYNEFAWTIYKHISADLRMKRRYLTYQIYIALLKFDFFFFLGFTIQFVVIITGGRTKTEFALTIAAIPLTIVILLFAAWFVRRENLLGMIGVITLYFCGFAYFVFKLYRMYSKSHEDFYISARKELTTFAVITIILIIMTIAVACMCASNFNKGLKPYVARRKPPNEEEKGGYNNELVSDPTTGKMALAPARMTID